MSGTVQIVVAATTSIPAAFAAFFAARTTSGMKRAVNVANDNSSKLDSLSNGMMDEKIERAVRNVLAESPTLITEANIAEVLNRILSEHLGDS